MRQDSGLALAKNEYRRQLKNARQKLPAKKYFEFSHRIQQNLLNSIDWAKVSTVHCYTGLDSLREVKTDCFFNTLWQNYPDIITASWQRNSNGVYVSKWVSISGFNQAVSPRTRFDVVVAPVLGFNNKLHRIGYGQGFYDDFLRIQRSSLKIGLGYEFAYLNLDFHEAHDQRLDCIITESQIHGNLSSLSI